MAKSSDDPHTIQPNDARGAHEAPNSSPHFNQRKKATKSSRIDRPENKENIQTLVEKNNGGKKFCLIKLRFAPLNNTINYFESNVITINVFTMFIQTIEVVNSYWFIYL